MLTLNQIPDAREIVYRPRRRRFASQPWSSGADWSPVLWQQPKCLPPRCVNPQHVLSCSNFTFFLHACTVWTFLPGLPPGDVFMCSSALWAHNHALLKMSSCLWTQIANQPTAGQQLSASRYVVKRTWFERQRAKRGLKWLHDITTISRVYRERSQIEKTSSVRQRLCGGQRLVGVRSQRLDWGDWLETVESQWEGMQPLVSDRVRGS